jgi:hypothetical protein
MPVVRDFRNYSYSRPRIERCGRYLGRNSYWKLYTIENVLRVVVHSVLSVQIGPGWWNSAVGPRIIRDVNDTRARYARLPHHTSPGVHEIHYIYLSSLNNLIRSNSNLFLPIIPDIDYWIVRVEGILTPRNLIGHMNFPHLGDRQRIDELHRDIGTLLAQLQQARIAIQIPR